MGSEATATTPAHRTPAQQLGDAAEELVAARLIAAGWRIIGRKVRVGRHELDLVALDPGPPPELVAIEVRWRASRDFGIGEETFGWRKRRQVRRGLLALLDRAGADGALALPQLPARIDLVIVEPSADPTAQAPVVRHHRRVATG